METFVVIAYLNGDDTQHSYVVSVCDSLFISVRYADTETASRKGTYRCRVYKKIMNAPNTELDALVYESKKRH